MERSLILNPTAPLTFEYLNLKVSSKKGNRVDRQEGTENLNHVISQHIPGALVKTSEKINGPGGAAAVLGIKLSTLRNRMKKIGINWGKISPEQSAEQ